MWICEAKVAGRDMAVKAVTHIIMVILTTMQMLVVKAGKCMTRVNSKLTSNIHRSDMEVGIKEVRAVTASKGSSKVAVVDTAIRVLRGEAGPKMRVIEVKAVVVKLTKELR